MTPEEIVANYIQNRRKPAAEEYRWFAEQRTLKDAITCAALAKCKHGKCSHQWRIPRKTLEDSARQLLAAQSKITKVKDFEELHQVVKSLIKPIKGIGDLTIYDTALRIGAWLKIEPGKVYLHAGTRVGAKRLGLDVSHDSIEVAAFPRAFHKLKPREIEDALCHYRGDIGGSTKRSSFRKRSGC